MSELRDLYQEVIIDHARRPRNFGPLEGASHHGEGFNPLCGDKLKLWIDVKDGVVADARFEGSGCAISTASASLLTETVKHKTLAEAHALFEVFHALVTGREPADDAPELGKLQVFAGVCEFPARVKCASLAWHTLETTLERPGAVVSTE